MTFDKAIVIRDKTRLELLVERFNSKAQAKFYLESIGADFGSYELEHSMFYSALNEVERSLSQYLKNKILFRSFVPTYLFTKQDLIIVVGQDGLVANTAKYVNGLPIIAINPNPNEYDGVLLPFKVKEAEKIIGQMIKGYSETRTVSMAEAKLQDGQRLLAFNDFYIGAASHVSSRYKIIYGERSEIQSSSGVLVSTGAGSTGWLSSVFNMTNNVNAIGGNVKTSLGFQMNWDDEHLIFVVREPFRSQASGVDLGYGIVSGSEKLCIESRMPNNGVVFSGGG
ncbi:MAG: sugar kinase, partial [Bacteroidetes bacterium]